jgi:hypothetical protein
MLEKIRKVYVLVALLCLVVVPVAHASPVQYVDQVVEGWVGIWDFFGDFMESVRSHTETPPDEPADPPEDDPPPANTEDGSGTGDDGAGDPGFGPLPDPIG